MRYWTRSTFPGVSGRNKDPCENTYHARVETGNLRIIQNSVRRKGNSASRLDAPSEPDYLESLDQVSRSHRRNVRQMMRVAFYQNRKLVNLGIPLHRKQRKISLFLENLMVYG